MKKRAEERDEFELGFKEVSETALADSYIKIHIQKRQERFKKIRGTKGIKEGMGEFFLLVDIAATKEDVYVPLSISSGKKPTGFVYHIEGTAQGTISTTNISCKGDGVTQITLGTIEYCRIPLGVTATFRILIEMAGKKGKEYKIVINRLHYKLNPTDARYQKFQNEMSTNTLKFS